MLRFTAFAGGGDGVCPCVDHLHEDGDELGRAHVVAVLLEVLVQAVDCAATTAMIRMSECARQTTANSVMVA